MTENEGRKREIGNDMYTVQALLQKLFSKPVLTSPYSGEVQCQTRLSTDYIYCLIYNDNYNPKHKW